MNNPWEQWSPYWWQTVTGVPPFGMRFEPSATYAQPNTFGAKTAHPRQLRPRRPAAAAEFSDNSRSRPTNRRATHRPGQPACLDNSSQVSAWHKRLKIGRKRKQRRE